MYNTHVFNSEDCLDSYWLDSSKHCYSSYKCFDSFKLFYSHWCYGCRDVFHSSFCRNLKNCFGCVHLENKAYHILNTEYTPDEYHQKIESILSNKEAFKDFLSDLKALQDLHASKNNTTQNSEEVSGDDIKDSKNAYEVYGSEDIQDAKYIYV